LFVPPLFVDAPEYKTHQRVRTRYFKMFEYVMAHSNFIYLHGRPLWRMARLLAGMRMDTERWLPFRRSLRNTIMAQRAYNELRKTKVRTDIIQGRLDFVVIRTQANKLFANNPHIAFHAGAHMHNLNSLAAKQIVQLLAQ
jgi:pimeloyl-ACP methyl ester carboxylesterase